MYSCRLVKNVLVRRLTMVGLLVMFSLRCAAGHIAVPPMPASPFADTEISTNVAFKTGVHGVKKLDVIGVR